MKLWNLATGRVAETLQGHAGPVRAVRVLGNGAKVVSCGQDETIKVWKVGKGKAQSLKGHENCVNCLALSRDGARMASGSDDRKIKVWEREEEKMG